MSADRNIPKPDEISSDGDFQIDVRVRYADADRLGVAYHSRYLEWFESARTEMLREFGIPYRDLEEKGFHLPVVEAWIRYMKPAFYDDLVVVRTSVSLLRMGSMRFEYEVLHKEQQTVLATGFTVHRFVDQKMEPARIPDELKRVVTPFRLLK